jgi:photosynthetic reaction center cytochrome c subunit
MNRASAGLVATLLGAAALMAGCERPPMDSTQTGFRGTAMGQVSNPRLTGPVQAAQVLPASIPAVPSPEGTPLAKDTYKNVQVLGELSSTELARTMLAITAWVSPQQGCAYCHVPGEDLSADTLYTKVVARRMMTMTRHINADWRQHVAPAGVTCYTCHRGEPVPAGIWFDQAGPRHAGGASAESDGHNHPSTQAGLTAMGVNVLSRFLVDDQAIRVAGTTALPAGNPATIKQAENSFGLMIHMSESLGVNCTHCHNTRGHVDWAQSPLARTTAWYGIRMTRDLNKDYLLPLTKQFPQTRLGPSGDVAKISCATCHQGVNKPLNGAPMVKDYPGIGTIAHASMPGAAESVLAASGGAPTRSASAQGIDAAALQTVSAAMAPARRTDTVVAGR